MGGGDAAAKKKSLSMMCQKVKVDVGFSANKLTFTIKVGAGCVAFRRMSNSF